MIQFEPFKLT